MWLSDGPSCRRPSLTLGCRPEGQSRLLAGDERDEPMSQHVFTRVPRGMKTMQLARSMFVIAAVVVSLAACGSDGDSDRPPATASTSAHPGSQPVPSGDGRFTVSSSQAADGDACWTVRFDSTPIAESCPDSTADVGPILGLADVDSTDVVAHYGSTVSLVLIRLDPRVTTFELVGEVDDHVYAERLQDAILIFAISPSRLPTNDAIIRFDQASVAVCNYRTFSVECALPG